MKKTLVMLFGFWLVSVIFMNMYTCATSRRVGAQCCDETMSSATESGACVILPEIWTRGLVKKESNFTKRHEKTDPSKIFA